jgi:hypothetical protein
MRKTLSVAIFAAGTAAAFGITSGMPSGGAGGLIVAPTASEPQSATASTTSSSTAMTTGSCPAPASSAGLAVCGLSGDVTLQDRVYFGTFWEGLDAKPETRAIAIGGGYVIDRIERTSEGDFFAGIVEKRDAAGRVTDVILAFAGADGPDAIQGESILLGIPLDEAARATSLYDGLLADPRLAEARIHVTGHSLGAGYTQYVLAHAIAANGAAATQARADFVAFGAPNWIPSAALHFWIDPADVAAQFVDFTSSNDPVLLNGVIRMGINNTLPAFTGLPFPNSALNAVAAHWPTTYASALGLPGWLTAAQQQAAMSALSGSFQTGNSIDPNYPAPGTAPLTLTGSLRGDRLHGMGGGDLITGGTGADILSGGAGADRFVWRGTGDGAADPDASDRIADFNATAGDRIDLAALAPLLGRLTFIGEAPFSWVNQVRYRVHGNDTVVEVNLAPGAAPELSIRLDGRIALRAGDFVLEGPLTLF